MALNSLDYRTPSRDLEHQRIKAMIERVEALLSARVLLLLGVGIGASVLTSAVGGGLLGRVLLRLGVGKGHENLIVWAAGFMVLVLMFLLEWRSRGQFLSDNIREHGIGMSERSFSSYGEYQMRSDAVAWVFYLEILLWGPRQVMLAFSHWREAGRTQRPAIGRAVELILQLREAKEGVPMAQTRRAGEPREDFLQLLAYLQLHDWVGVGDRGKRVWLSSRAKSRLAKMSALPS